MVNETPSLRPDRTHLQTIIADLPEGVILIEPDQTIAWANRAALAMHGVERVAELGRTVADYRECFALRYLNQQAVSDREYPMDRLIAGDQFADVVVEVTKAGGQHRRVLQVRGLVLHGRDGRPDCLVVMIEDDTARYDAEQRFERTFAANPAPAIIVRLDDMRYVKVNQGFLELTGFTREALIGRSMHEYDVLENAERRDLAVARLHAAETVPQMEGLLRTAHGHPRTVLMAGQPIEIGDALCMLFTFADLHPRQQAHDALRHSEQRFSAAFRLAPVPMMIIALQDARVVDVNDAFTRAIGWRREEMIGRTEPEFRLWGSGQGRDELVQQLTQTGYLRSVDVRVAAKDGRQCHYLVSAETVVIHGESCLLTVMQDITERKQTEMELLRAIDAVMKDTSWFGQRVVEKLTNLTRSGETFQQGPAIADLTPRARDVLALVAEGLPDDLIAEQLGISRNTVKNHVSAIYKATGSQRRSELVVWARERGLGVRKNAPVKQRARRRRSPA